MKLYRKIIFVLVIALAILLQLANPTLARADGETEPPPPTEAAVEPPPPTEEPAVEVMPAESIATESPVAPEADAASVDDPNTSIETTATELPIASEADAAPIDDLNTSIDTAATEDTSLLEAIQELPAQTDVVILDESGKVLPLATREAADVIVSGDPIWCPDGVNPGGAGCSPSYKYFTVEDPVPIPGGLIGWLNNPANAATVSQAGTIWIASSYYSSAHESAILIDGASVAGTMEDFPLAFQGGWNGALDRSGTITTTNSVFSVPITITNWNAAVTVNNITISGAAGDGLTISSSRDVTINNSTFKNSAGSGASGAFLYDVGAVTINHSTFTGNDDMGLDLGLSDSVTISNNSTFNKNKNDGAAISTSNATITDSTFSQNSGNGVALYSANRATITGNTFDRNNENGAKLYTIDSASISNNIFKGNHTAGLAMDSPEDFYTIATIENNSFIQNGTGIGLIGEPSSSIGMSDGKIKATLKCNTFQGNGADITSSGDVTVIDKSCGSDPTPYPQVANFIQLSIDCSLNNSFLVQWVSGDQVLLSCVDGGIARISRVDNTTLSRDMPAGFEYAFGFLIEIFQNGVPLTVLPDGGFIQFEFASRHENPQYGIMYWDEENGDWIQLKEYQVDTVGTPVSFPLHSSNQQDEYRVLSGARLLVDGNRYREEVTTNFPGIFILAQH